MNATSLTVNLQSVSYLNVPVQNETAAGLDSSHQDGVSKVNVKILAKQMAHSEMLAVSDEHCCRKETNER